MDSPIKICETCGQTVPDYPFKVGDRVRHMSGDTGVVDRIGKCVEVQFDGFRGTYDRVWFKAYKLEKII